MKAALLAGAALLGLAAPAAGLDVPVAVDPKEPRMRQQAYRPHGLTLLPITVGRSAVITLAPDESIKRVVLGQDTIVSPPKSADVGNGAGGGQLGNVLPLWADSVGDTTMQVITQRADGTSRVYPFLVDIRQVPASCESGLNNGKCIDDPDAVYVLAFTYPDDERAKRAATAAEARLASAERQAASQRRRERETAVERLATDFTCVNGRYKGVGDRSIVPDDVCDDGQAIGLLYRGQRQMPAAFVLTDDGKPHAIRTHARGNWLVIPALRGRIRLILDDKALDIIAEAPDPRGRNTGTGTGSPDVVREIVRSADGGGAPRR